MNNSDLLKAQNILQQFNLKTTAKKFDNSVTDDDVQKRNIYNDFSKIMTSSSQQSFITEMLNNSEEVSHQHSSYKLLNIMFLMNL